MSHAYLFAYVALTELYLGSLAILCFEPLVSPEWLRPMLPAVRGTQRLGPALAAGFALLGLLAPRLYPWVHAHSSPYLTLPGFWIRGALCWALWLALSRRAVRNAGALAAPGLVMLVLTGTFAAVDWVMSLSPSFGSTAFGLVFFLSGLLLAFGFAAFLGAPKSSESQRQDQGSVHLSLVCVWTYVTFMQFLVVWSGNLPREAVWYLQRSSHGWQLVPALLAIGQFAVPFTLLLFRRVKRSLGGFRLIAAASLAMQAVFTAWQVLPDAGSLLVMVPALLAGLALAACGLWLAGKEAHAARA